MTLRSFDQRQAQSVEGILAGYWETPNTGGFPEAGRWQELGKVTSSRFQLDKKLARPAGNIFIRANFPNRLSRINSQ